MAQEVLKSILDDDFAELEQLRKQGFDVAESTEKEGWNYLHRALLGSRRQPTPRMLGHLIELGNDVNAVDIHGNTPLHYAARLKSAELVRVLVEAHADVNQVNKDGVCPLRQSVIGKPRNHEATRLLLEAGADMHQKTEGGKTVREYVAIIAHSDPALVEIFDEYA
ncbi:MAG: ankyrin repeat domain-containing protein [Woeseiaceae bacterium]|nr:ankyrin repeat domain-containing protein [Woeseiaceae bacterium]